MTNKPHNDAILDEALCRAVGEVFAGCGVPLETIGVSPEISFSALDCVGVLGFAGARMRGTLVIATSVALVSRTYPPEAGVTVAGRDQVRDWIGELCNLTLGRIKVTLARYGQDLGLSTPVALTGEHLRLGAIQRNRSRAWDFRAADGDLRVWIETDIDPHLRLELVEDSGVHLGAGDTLLF